jgi:thiamine monophosphate kinase
LIFDLTVTLVGESVSAGLASSIAATLCSILAKDTVGTIPIKLTFVAAGTLEPIITVARSIITAGTMVATTGKPGTCLAIVVRYHGFCIVKIFH